MERLSGPRPTPALGKLSVIVPTRNERLNLPKLLATLPPAVELLVCDASDDGTSDLALELRPDNTRVLRTTGSIAAARQHGAEQSRGDVLVFTDADVCFDDGYFERLIDGWGEKDGVCGPKLSRDEYADYYRSVAASQRLTYALFGVAGASGSNMALTRAAFDRVGGFRIDLRCNEDTELFLRAGRRGLQVAYDDALVVWAGDHRRLHRGSTRKSAHSLLRNMLLYLYCCRPTLPRLLYHDWGYWRPAPAARQALSPHR